MFRSLQSKLVIVYLLLILVAMEVTGLYLLQSLRAYYENSFSVNLTAQAQLLTALAQRYMEGRTGAADSAENTGLSQLVSEWGHDTGISVMILDNQGEVIGASQLQRHLVGSRLSSDVITFALGGSSHEEKAIDPETGDPALFMAVPIRSEDQILGVVYLKGSLSRTYEILGDIRWILVTATVLALAFTAVLGTALARTITGPIREVTAKAAQMAQGDFDQTIPARSTDEVGQLASMFNHLAGRLKETLAEISDERNKLEAILAYMADGLVALDRDGRIIRVNQAAARMTSIDAEAAVGLTPAELWPDLEVGPALAEAKETGQTVVRELVRRTPQGERTLLFYVSPLRGERGLVGGAVMVLHDITEFQRLESMRRDFVANVSHELKTPLTTVKSYVETLLDGAVEDPQVRTRFLQVVETETDRMVRLVRDLLHLSQMDSNTVAWVIQPVDLRVVAEEALARLSVTSERKLLTIHREFAPDLPQALVDRDKILQVMLNILANAIDFTPQGGQIWVQIDRQDSLVRARVKDTGIGIPAADLPRIFERFYRVDKARTRTLGGTGLGLAIALQIIERLGGSIAIDSEPGRGTEVTFTVPVAADGQSLQPGEMAGEVAWS